jgi:hypothetical protein
VRDTLAAGPLVASAHIGCAGTIDAGGRHESEWCDGSLLQSRPGRPSLPLVISGAAVHPPRPLQSRRRGRARPRRWGGCRCPCPWWRRLVHRRLVAGSRPVMANRRRQLELLLIVRRAERDGLVRVPVRRPRDRRGDLAVSAEGRARGDARKTTDSGRADWRYVQQEQSRYWSGRQQ